MGDDKKIERDEKGIPLKAAAPHGMPVWMFYTVMNIIFGVVGYALAYFVAYKRNSNKIEGQLNILKEYDLGWLYLGIFLLKTLQLPIYIILGEARKASKVTLPDQQVYKVMGSEGSKLGYVLMETDGVLGEFNRAQRALMNYHEVLPTLIVIYVAASFVFPFEAFVCIVAFALSRCFGALGYKSSTDGRMSGMLMGLLSQVSLQGMVLLVAIQSLS